MGVFFMCWGTICALKNKKPITTWVIGYIVEAAGVDLSVYLIVCYIP